MINPASHSSASFPAKSAGRVSENTAQQAEKPVTSPSADRNNDREAVVVSVKGDNSGQQQTKPVEADQQALSLSRSIREQHGVIEIRSLEDAEPTGIRFSEDVERANQVAHAKFQKMSAKVAETMQELIAYLEPAEPIPERALTGEEAEAARARFKDADPVMTSTDGAKSFLENEMLYRISANGDVTVRHQLIPTSEDAKQSFLADLRQNLEEALAVTGGRSLEEIDRDIAALTQRSGGGAVRQDQAAVQHNASQPGQIFDQSA